MKLAWLAFVPILGAILVTALAITNIYGVTGDMEQTLYHEAYQGSAQLTNADRDLFQALSAYQEIGRIGVSAEKKAELLKTFDENGQQAVDRANQALEILKQHEEAWGTIKFPNSGRPSTITSPPSSPGTPTGRPGPRTR
jgi:methyl-accepting chemotaxis protein